MELKKMPAPIKKHVVTVRLTNRWVSFLCDNPDTISLLKPHFSFEHPRKDYIESYTDGSWDGNVCMLNRGRVQSGLFLAKQAELSKEFRITIDDRRELPSFAHKLGESDLRDYQSQAINAMIKHSSSGGIVLSATGTGKTRLAGGYFRRLQGPAVFIVDELSLLVQSRDAISEFLGEKVGIIGKGEFAPERITIAMIQTLALHRRKREFKKWLGALDAIIIDEVHVAINKRDVDLISQAKPLAVFGLTATLQMQRPHVAMPAMALCGPVIFRYSLQQGVEEGHLSRGLILALKFDDPSGPAPTYTTVDKRGQTVKVSPWSRPAKYRHHIVKNKARNEMICRLVNEGARLGRRIVVLVEAVQHIGLLDRLLEGVPHAVLHGAVSTRIRRAAVKDMDTGRLPLILATRVLGKGVDIQTVDMIVDATGLPGRDASHQRYGRGARKAEGKGLLYVDISDRGSPMARAAVSRLHALRELGTKIVVATWKQNPKSIMKNALARLQEEVSEEK